MTLLMGLISKPFLQIGHNAEAQEGLTSVADSLPGIDVMCEPLIGNDLHGTHCLLLKTFLLHDELSLRDHFLCRGECNLIGHTAKGRIQLL